ncbi:MAG: class I tRNA ligase family protein, partial [Planctomycetota bacterium]
MPETTKTNYKGTLNLPRTSFAMRARLNAAEPQSQQRWEQMRLYERVVADREGQEPFAFHDGPPYANELLHVGHLLNKVLKDLVVRTRMMAGKYCRFVPGWDCHGLPIEHKVMLELLESNKLEALERLSDDERRLAIRRECRAYAEKFQKLQAEQMKRLLALADYDHPYLTMTPDYERGVLEVFASLVEQGLVYRALKSVHWSIENRTALADAELEYHDKEDVSVYVAFEAADRGQVATVFGVELDQTPSFMIWTTTPWTLPANLAIAVNDRFSYALVAADGDVTVIAEDLVETVTKAGRCESVRVLGTASGRALVGLTYRHPFCDRTCPVVPADYVTLEDGTGLVHTAPGHGEEDNLTAVREGLEIYCPVQEDGTYDDSVPEWLRGMSIWEANGKVVEHLRASGHLFHSHSFVHSYPHDWRSKTPVIFRATEQWFIGVDTPLSSPADE